MNRFVEKIASNEAISVARFESQNVCSHVYYNADTLIVEAIVLVVRRAGLRINIDRTKWNLLNYAHYRTTALVNNFGGGSAVRTVMLPLFFDGEEAELYRSSDSLKLKHRNRDVEACLANYRHGGALEVGQELTFIFNR